MEFVEIYDNENRIDVMINICHVATVSLETRNERLVVILDNGKEIVVCDRCYESLKQKYERIRRAISDYETKEVE